MKPANQALLLAVPAAVLAAFSLPAHAALVLFQDTFSNGAPGSAVSINAPDPLGNPETVADNTSVSGTILSTFGPDQRPWAGDNAGGGTLGGEAGGVASWQRPGTGTASGTISVDYDFATNPDLVAAGQFTIYLGGLDPIDTGSGTDGNWAALSLFRTSLPSNGGGTDVNNAASGLGILFRDSGLLQVFSAGTNILGDTSFDATPTGGSYDVIIEISNISGFGAGNSFDYNIIVDGSPITGGSRTGIDTSANFLSLESRTGSSTIDEFRVETIPEPATAALLALGGLALLRRRRQDQGAGLFRSDRPSPHQPNQASHDS